MNGQQIQDLKQEDKVAEIHAVITATGDFFWKGPDDEITFRGLLDLLHNRFEEKLRERKQQKATAGLIKEVRGVLLDPTLRPRYNGG